VPLYFMFGLLLVVEHDASAFGTPASAVLMHTLAILHVPTTEPPQGVKVPHEALLLPPPQASDVTDMIAATTTSDLAIRISCC
jgi:hypothetical protein